MIDFQSIALWHAFVILNSRKQKKYSKRHFKTNDHENRIKQFIGKSEQQ